MPEDTLLLRLRAAGARGTARAVDSVGSAVRRTGTAAGATTTRLGKFGSVMNGTSKKMSAVSRGLRGAGGALNALTFPILGAAAVSGKLAIDFDKAMRNVNSIAQLPERQLQNLRRGVLDLAGPTAQAPQTLAEGMYDLVSSGFKAKESLLIMRSSAQAATAGLTNAATSTHAMAAVLNAYRLSAKDANDVSDTLFQTVNLGVITFEELSQNIGDTLPFSASLGVNLRELGAATATMTKQGLGAPETFTRIRNLMQTMIKPGEGLKKAFKELGVESGETLIKQKGFQGALEAVVGTTDGSKKAVAALFPNIRALGGALALTGKNSEAARKDLAGMNKSQGATGRALSQQSQSASYQFNKLLANLKVLAIELGTAFLPAMNDVATWIGKVAKAFQALSPSQQKTIVIIALLVGVLGPLLILLGAVVGAASVLASTAGAVTIGVLALAAGVTYAYTRWGWFRDAVQIAWEILKRMPAVWIITHIKSIIGWFEKIPGAIKAGWISAVNFMIDRINDIINTINFAIKAFNKLPGPDIGPIGTIGHIGTTPQGGPGINYGGFNPLTGRPTPPTGPTPFGGHRIGPRFPRRPAASTASAAGTDGGSIELTLHNYTMLDGRPVAKSVRRQSVKARSTS